VEREKLDLTETVPGCDGGNISERKVGASNAGEIKRGWGGGEDLHCPSDKSKLSLQGIDKGIKKKLQLKK